MVFRVSSIAFLICFFLLIFSETVASLVFVGYGEMVVDD